MIKGLAHIGVFVKDLEVSKKFYTETLGFEAPCELTNEADGAKICFVRRGDCHLELVEFPEYREKADGFVDHIAMLTDDIEGEVNALREKGVAFETEEPVFLEKVYRGCRYILFRGPDGEHLELDEML